MLLSLLPCLASLGFLFRLSPAGFAQSPPALLRVDASEANRGIFHVRETLSLPAGRFTLAYPKWIPGEHAPTGTMNGVINLRLSAGGNVLPWKRDDLEMFHLGGELPEAGLLEIAFDYAAPPNTITTSHLARIKWNRLLLAPQGVSGDTFRVRASLKVPPGWKLSTALPPASDPNAGDSLTEFAPVSLHTLIDSPVLTGSCFRRIPLAAGTTPPHEIDLYAETAAETEMPPALIEGYTHLVGEAGALFGARHYGSYRWLLSLSDLGGAEGLEHHECSEDGVDEKAFTETGARLDLADLLSHEFTHSWNGKYRRPVGLATSDYSTPMKGELLWVYEGMTQHWGKILPVRSGLWTEEEFRDNLASTAARLDHTRGRDWRPLADTAVAVQFTYGNRGAWASSLRGADYYDESTLIWLEADTLLRQKSGGKRSLDDFCKKFHGGSTGKPELKPYTFEEVVSTLEALAPYNWRGFLIQRVYQVQPHAPLGGIENSGWRLVYNDTPNERDQPYGFKGTLLTYSLGTSVDADGKIADVIEGMPAAKAGLAPGMKIIGVNGRKYTSEGLLAAVKATKSGEPLELLVEDNEFLKTFRPDYRGGERFPHLERDRSKPDLLSAILAPRSWKPKQ